MINWENSIYVCIYKPTTMRLSDNTLSLCFVGSKFGTFPRIFFLIICRLIHRSHDCTHKDIPQALPRHRRTLHIFGSPKLPCHRQAILIPYHLLCIGVRISFVGLSPNKDEGDAAGVLSQFGDPFGFNVFQGCSAGQGEAH